ncbi:HNH endonuclease signature motif containing protein [Microbacterium thalli]|uniref:HNH endonuclease signature motif containing protein n=1 Tax=Microbacterium thalli TaxID=3027921 RepID=UPI00236556CD|nr:HNH endonuclease signature motif containing protein [Microbacterium thalli]MDD7930099.1 HNH endonuclease signature motif containing protein [Microbacterium thalli]
MTRSCAIEGCDKAYRSRGRCWTHRVEALASGVPLPDYREAQHRPAAETVPCRLDGCDNVATYKGERLCMAHYLRRLVHGTFELPAKVTAADRIEAEVEQRDGCWIWTGAVSTSGYGRLGDDYAHRVSYVLAKGAIPAGLQIDHLCFQKLCINPEHLEAVTQAENLRRQNLRMQRAADGTWRANTEGAAA